MMQMKKTGGCERTPVESLKNAATHLQLDCTPESKMHSKNYSWVPMKCHCFMEEKLPGDRWNNTWVGLRNRVLVL